MQASAVAQPLSVPHLSHLPVPPSAQPATARAALVGPGILGKETPKAKRSLCDWIWKILGYVIYPFKWLLQCCCCVTANKPTKVSSVVAVKPQLTNSRTKAKDSASKPVSGPVVQVARSDKELSTSNTN